MTSSLLIHCAGLCLYLIGALAPPLNAAPRLDEGAQVFAQELERAQVKMSQGKWKSARVQLERALASHEDKSYVLAHLGEIELILKRCAYWESSDDVKVESFFKGELLSYSSGNGNVKVRYPDGSDNDFTQRGMALVHDIEFSGAYSIEVVDGSENSIVVCATPDSSYQVTFSRTFYLGKNHPKHKKPTERKVTITSKTRDAKGQWITEEKTKDFTTPRTDSRKDVKVSVSSNSVTAYFNGKSRLSVKKPRDLWGQLALPLGEVNGTIVLTGDASSYIKSKQDEAFEKGWKTFERRWRPEKHLPGWLVHASRSWAPGEEKAESETRLNPSDLSQEQVRLWNTAVEALQGGDFGQALEKLGRLAEEEPRLAAAHFLRAQALVALKRRPEAIEALAPCLESFPDYLDGMGYLARLHLVAGQFDEVLQVVSRGIEAGIRPAEFQAISITANKAIHGPAWSEKHDYQSRHYTVASDISPERCRQVAMELEETYRYISRRMGVGEHAENRKFQVYAFSGQASYLDYIEDVFEGKGEFTQGMYSNYLKQLLVLDSEPRETFMHTVRHEGFHQYFDSILDDPPIWLNEGLAEYFAASRTPQKTWRDGRTNEGRLAHLRSRPTVGLAPIEKLKPLRDFIIVSHTLFMAEGPDNYAQAWAFVHYLRHSTVENKGRFKTLMDELLAGSTNEAALDRAFDGVDWKALDRELKAHIERL